MIRCFFLPTLVMLLASVPTIAEAQVTLRHEFPDGRKSISETIIKTSQTLTLAGKELVSGSEQSLTVSAANGERAADGTLTVNSKIEALKTKVTLPGGVEIEFDSAKPDAPPPGTQFDFLLDIFKATTVASWESVMNNENRVVAVKGRDAAYAGLPQNIRDAMKTQMEPEYLKTAANDELTKLPFEPVSPGDSWERTNTVRLDSGQRFTFTNKYTYEGSVQQNGKNLERIASKTTDVAYFVEGESPIKVLESDLKVAASDGEILFDSAFGEVVSQRSELQIKGSLKLELMEMELPGQLDLTMENNVETVVVLPKIYRTTPFLGEIRLNGLAFAPRGWANCDGQLLSIKNHVSLFSLLGTTYGGDGIRDFRLPDLRGRVPVHAGKAPGLAKVWQGQKLNGKQVTSSTAPDGTVTQPSLSMRYVISLEGIYPPRRDVAKDNASILEPFVGEIRMFAGIFAPHGWANCDGQQLASFENKSLFAAIGRSFGGDATNFSLPDLRARIPVHAGQGSGLDRVKLGERGGRRKLAPAKDVPESVSTRSCLGIRYIIALRGIDPTPSVDVTSLMGEICVLAGESVPRGWASCDGQLLSTKENQALFSLLGTTYGGDGRTTFALPDLRGRTPVHSGESQDLIPKVRLGQRHGGTSVAIAKDSEPGVSTQPYLGVRYIISLHGVYPSRDSNYEDEFGAILGLDHFKFYNVAPVEMKASVTLRGQFDKDAVSASLAAIERFASPVTQYGAQIISPSSHLTWYKLVQGVREPRRAVEFENEFGIQIMLLGQPVALLAPTKTVGSGSEIPNDLDHYKVYEVLEVKPIKRKVPLIDQFGAKDDVTIGKTMFFAVPVIKKYGDKVSPIVNVKAHLTFYAILPKKPINMTKETVDHFGKHKLAFVESELLALPTFKLAWKAIED